MEQLKTTLKFHFHSVKFAYKMLAVSAEVFCRHSFGRRYAPVLLASFLCCFVTLSLLRKVVPQNCPHVVDIYLLSFFIVVLGQIVQMWRPRATIQSHSSGRSFTFWSWYNVNPNVVKILIEPLISVLFGLLFLPINQLVSMWVLLGGLCLFIKETLGYFQFNNRILDAIDARLEGERIGAGVRQQTAPQTGGAQTVSPVVAADPGQPPASPIQQIYSRLDPALQRLIAAPNQNRPTTPAPVRPARLVVTHQPRPAVKPPSIAPSQRRPKPPWR